MREPVKDPARLEHMIEAIDRINGFVTGKSQDEIKQDSILYYAVVKNIEIIGEAAYMLTTEFRDAHPSTPWKVIIGMRHFLVHGYYEVDPHKPAFSRAGFFDRNYANCQNYAIFDS